MQDNRDCRWYRWSSRTDKKGIKRATKWWDKIKIDLVVMVIKCIV